MKPCQVKNVDVVKSSADRGCSNYISLSVINNFIVVQLILEVLWYVHFCDDDLVPWPTYVSLGQLEIDPGFIRNLYEIPLDHLLKSSRKLSQITWQKCGIVHRQLQYTSVFCNDTDGLVQDCSISIANKLEILLSCTEPLMYNFRLVTCSDSIHTLQLHPNGHDGVSNHQPHDCLLFTQPFIQAQIKENIKAPRHWPLCREFTGDQWIPRTRGQKSGKCFHLMRSSCQCLLIVDLIHAFFFQNIKLAFSIISPLWYGVGSWNPVHLHVCIFDTKAANVLATHGARATAAIIWT